MTLSLAFAYVAGILSTLSPCVLPLLPVIFSTAVSEHRLAPAALAAGLVISFVAIGMFVATIGFGIGLDTQVFRVIAAILLIAIGIVLAVPRLQDQVAVAASPVGGWMHDNLGGFNTSGIHGQFALGLLLGAVWSPCVGPTLGAASVLAAKGENLGEVFLVMSMFGVGAATPLLLLGLLSRETMMKFRGKMMNAGSSGKLILGVLLIAAGFLIISGLDKALETQLIALSPEWLTRLTTSY